MFVELFPVFFCEKITFKVGLFSLATFSLWAQKVNQQPVVTCDIGNREEAIYNEGPRELLSNVYSWAQYSRQASIIMLQNEALSHGIPI